MNHAKDTSIAKSVINSIFVPHLFSICFSTFQTILVQLVMYISSACLIALINLLVNYIKTNRYQVTLYTGSSVTNKSFLTRAII